MQTRRTELLGGSYRDEEHYEMPGLRRWIRRNSWLLARLVMVVIFTFGASLVGGQFSYGLVGAPKPITAQQINSGNLPKNVGLGDYVKVSGVPQVGRVTPQTVGTAESQVGVSARYEVSYFYFRLKGTKDNLLIQAGNELPRFDGESRTWSGKLSNVGTVIFHNTTQEGLKRANLPHAENIPVVEVGETPQAYRNLFPAYSVVIVIWALSVAWLLWKRNKPFA